jgi:hypothetical protein
VGSRGEFSAQTLSVLAALREEPSQWRHGYAPTRQAGLKPGTLYPILIHGGTRQPGPRQARFRPGCGGWPGWPAECR